jgi:hypothetical protein
LTSFSFFIGRGRRSHRLRDVDHRELGGDHRGLSRVPSRKFGFGTGRAGLPDGFKVLHYGFRNRMGERSDAMER